MAIRSRRAMMNEENRSVWAGPGRARLAGVNVTVGGRTVGRLRATTLSATLIVLLRDPSLTN